MAEFDIKSNFFAIRYRETGNRHFQKREYFEALMLYNRSLCCAIGNVAISMAYANRSAVYMKLNHFDLCLENIQLARENNYPREKMEKLDNREKECKELMKTLKPNPYDDPFNYFKLSYPPNPKYPQMVDCLELRKNHKGAHVVTTRDLKSGDIIAIEEPNFALLYPRARLHRCNFCTKDQLMNLIPCSGCAMAMFCSENCLQKALIGFHHFECKNQAKAAYGVWFSLHMLVECLRLFDFNIEELQKFLDVNKKTSTVFDFDFSNPNDPMYEKNMMLVSLSNTFAIDTNHDLIKKLSRKLLSSFAQQNEKFGELWSMNSKSFINLINTYDGFCSGSSTMGIFSKDVNFVKTEKDIHLNYFSLDRYQHGIKKFLVGVAVYPLTKLFNNSCDPNVIQLDVSGKSVICVTKPIKKGSKILTLREKPFYFYGPASERKRNVESICCSTCNCEACEKNWPTIEGLPSVDPSFHYEQIHTLSTHDQATKNLARNNAYINANFKEHNPTKEVYFTIGNNFCEYGALSRPSFYP